MNKRETLKSMIGEFSEKYADTCQRTRQDYISTLAPGSRIPEGVRIYGEDERKAFEGVASDYRAKASKILDEEISKAKDQLTTAPSDEGVRVCSLLKMRDNVSRDEVNDLISKYGDNVQTYKAITAIAHEKGIKGFNNHPVEEKVSAYESLKKSLDSYFTLNSAENGKTSAGSSAFLGLFIDDAFPE